MTSKVSQQHVILITGVTGIGKTGLARSIQRHWNTTVTTSTTATTATMDRRSMDTTTTGDIISNPIIHNDDIYHSNGYYFVVGKYDQLQRPEPHGALVEVCTQLIQQIIDYGLTDQFGITLANHGIDDHHHGGHDWMEMIPSLHQILKSSSTKTVPEKGSSSSSDRWDHRNSMNSFSTSTTTDVVSSHGLSTNRWKDVFRLFFRAVSTMHATCRRPKNDNHNNIPPIVVLMEDLHWADESSMDVLQTLLQDKANHNILFICTYRTEHYGPSTNAWTLERFIKCQKQNNVTMTHLALTAIPHEAITPLICHVLSVDREQAEPLASIFQNWSKGNAFLLCKCFTILYFKNLIRTDPVSEHFVWDNDEIYIEMDAIKDMMTYKIGLLHEASRENIKVAACLGSKLNEDILVRLFSGKEAAVSAFIDDAASHHLLSYNEHRKAWCFSHDYIQEKVYETIPSNERHVYHYRIGRKLWREFAMDELTDFLFLVVGQLLLGMECIKDQRERVAVAKLCLGAGVRAFQLSNFQSSFTYLKSGITLLPEEAWDDEYDLMMNLHNTAAEVANSLGMFTDVHTLVTESLKHSKSYEDTYRANATQLQALGRCGKLEEAIQSGMDILTDLGEKLPTKQHLFHTLMEFVSLRRRLRRKTNEMIMRLPTMTNPMKLAAMEIMNLIFLHTAIVQPELTPLIGCRMVKMSLDHGLSALSCVGFAIFAAAVAG
jgi:predicted ATPase